MALAKTVQAGKQATALKVVTAKATAANCQWRFQATAKAKARRRQPWC